MDMDNSVVHFKICTFEVNVAHIFVNDSKIIDKWKKVALLLSNIMGFVMGHLVIGVITEH